MTRKFFQGDEKVFQEEFSQYQIGEGIDYSELAEEILEAFERRAQQDFLISNDRFIGKNLLSRIQEEPNLDGTSLIAAVIRRTESTHGGQGAHLGGLLNNLVEIVYGTGENNIVLDYRGLLGDSIYHTIGENLKGHLNKLISVSYFLSENFPATVGTGASNCGMHIKGNVWSVGKEATNSFFELYDTPSNIGIGARNCSFYLSNATGVNSFDRKERGPTHNRWSCYELSITDSQGTKEMTFNRDFFRSGNRLLIPKGANEAPLHKKILRWRFPYLNEPENDWKKVVPGPFMRMNNAVIISLKEDGWDTSEWQ